LHNNVYAGSQHLRDTLSVTCTLNQKIACLERELRFRFRVYPRRIAQGLLSQAAAAHEIKVMTDILDDYRKQRDPELEL
jgi:hypothetical protein